jgi:hypothetical protein
MYAREPLRLQWIFTLRVLACSRTFKQPVSTMLQYRLYGGKSLPAGLQGFLKASANIGSMIGQFGFGESHFFWLFSCTFKRANF